ncbi:MAG: hypothetical protein HUU08_06945 [Candidatus Brocadia sp.]|nr:hypothetical protein [Candidatus Brocadia sp.]
MRQGTDTLPAYKGAAFRIGFGSSLSWLSAQTRARHVTPPLETELHLLTP